MTHKATPPADQHAFRSTLQATGEYLTSTGARSQAALAAADQPSQPLLVAAKQAAILCGMSQASWHRKNAAGLIPRPVRIGPGCVRWRRAELEAWTAAGCPDRRTWEALQASPARNAKR